MDNEKKIYVITAGEYSDYHICAVTTDKERAEFLKKWYYGDNTRIREFIDGDHENVPDTIEFIPVWYVDVKEDGDVVTCVIDRYAPQDRIPDATFEFFRSFYDCNRMHFKGILAAQDKEHAIKIVKDKRAKMLAERFGI